MAIARIKSDDLADAGSIDAAGHMVAVVRYFGSYPGTEALWFVHDRHGLHRLL